MSFPLARVGFALACIAIVFGGWLGWQLLRQNGRTLLRLDELEKRLNELEFGVDEWPKGLPLGSEAPPFELPDLDGERKSLAQFRGQPVLLIFFNPDCGFCRGIVPELAALARRPVPLSAGRASENPMADDGRDADERRPLMLVLTNGDAEKNRQFFAEHTTGCAVLRQNDGEVAKMYQADGTPTGYLVDAKGKIGSAFARGAQALLKLATQPVQELLPGTEGEQIDGHSRANRFRNRSLAQSKIRRDGLKAGELAPDFRLPRLDGKGELGLEELRGRRVLLVFSSPNCGPCIALAPQLEQFHRAHPEIQVVMVSKGEPRDNRQKVKEHSLTFPIVLQQQWEISRRYAIFATPVAYLIDEKGTIVDNVAVGVEPIQTLMAGAWNCFRERAEIHVQGRANQAA